MRRMILISRPKTVPAFLIWQFLAPSEQDDPCDPNPCHHGGICEIDLGSDQGFICLCEHIAWNGVFCHEKVCQPGYVAANDQCVQEELHAGAAAKANAVIRHVPLRAPPDTEFKFCFRTKAQNASSSKIYLHI